MRDDQRTEHPTMIGCPACAGCLSLEKVSNDHHQFVCSVGHRFSLWDLYESKETELEQAEWSTIALLKHLEMILQMLLNARDIPEAPGQSDIRERLAQIERQITSVQHVIEGTRMLARQGRNVLPSEVSTEV